MTNQILIKKDLPYIGNIPLGEKNREHCNY